MTKVVLANNFKTVGKIELTSMKQTVLPDTIMAVPSQSGNSARYYLSAINHYNYRRRQHKLLPRSQRRTDEPLVDTTEIDLFRNGYKCKDFVPFKSKDASLPEYASESNALSKSDYETNPYDEDSLPSTLRLLCQAMLNEGMARQSLQRYSESEALYKYVLRLSERWLSVPASLLDMTVGLEIEMKACHYLENLYSITHDSRSKICRDVSNSANELVQRVGKKYKQLDDTMAAQLVLQKDESPVWRVEALTALNSSLYYHRLSWPETQMVKRTISAASKKNILEVQHTASIVAKLPGRFFKNPGTEQSLKARKKGAGS